MLQKFSAMHLKKTREWINNPEISIPFLFDRFVTEEEHERWFQRTILDTTQAIYAIYSKDKIHIGNIGLKNIDKINRKAELWVYIGDLSERKKGYAKKAIAHLLEKAFDIFSLRKIYLHVRQDNISAISTYKSNNFVEEGISKDAFEFKGEKFYLLRMSINDSDWKADKGPRVALMQPTFLPWIGYFELMDSVDYFVLLDDFQFSRQSWGQRNKIFLSPGKPGIITLPIKHDNNLAASFLDIKCSENGKWKKKLLTSIYQCYRKAQYFPQLYNFMEIYINKKYNNIFEILFEYISYASQLMEIHPKILRSSQIEYDRTLHRSHKVLSILESLSTRLYYSPAGSFPYMKEDMVFPTTKVDVCFQNHIPVKYPQICSKTFIPYMSSFDVLCNVSPSQAKAISRGTNRWLTWEEMDNNPATLPKEKIEGVLEQ